MPVSTSQPNFTRPKNSMMGAESQYGNLAGRPNRTSRGPGSPVEGRLTLSPGPEGRDPQGRAFAVAAAIATSRRVISPTFAPTHTLASALPVTGASDGFGPEAAPNVLTAGPNPKLFGVSGPASSLGHTTKVWGDRVFVIAITFVVFIFVVVVFFFFFFFFFFIVTLC